MKSASHSLLVVEEQADGVGPVERIVARYRLVRVATTTDEATRLLVKHRDWCGFVVDADVAGGLEILAALRDRYSHVPALLVSKRMNREIVNRAAALGATIVGKPFGEPELAPFLQRVVGGQHGFSDEFVARLAQVSRSWRLSPREHEILAWHLAGGTREEYLKKSGVAESTFKTHVKRMLSKADAENLAQLTHVAFRHLMQSSLPPRNDS